jgi:predicted ATPase/transcriptional regulator with XRE-family HTH domain
LATTDEPRAFGRLLRQYRLASSLTQEALAERTGLGVRSIQHLEGGMHLPQRETIGRLVRTLGLSGEERRGFEEAAQPTPRQQGFGPLLRQYRLAASLTQEALAERAGLGLRSVQALESGTRLPLRDTLKALTEALGLVFEQCARLTSAAQPVPRRRNGPASRRKERPQHPAGDPAVRVPNNLPIQWTSFVGSEYATIDLIQLLKSTHLLTLTGTGGCGKTRLALEVAKRGSDAFFDGVWLVDLAPVADSALVAQTAASVIGVREAPGEPILQTLTRHLWAKRDLLVFDNCEHVIEGSARIIDTILHSCPGVRVLATSREALRITGEVSWRVPSLEIPPTAGSVLKLDQVASYGAARLFLDRARATEPGFELTAENVAAVIQICQQLDGMPLAIELAAAQVSALGLGEIAARLDDRFRLLTGGSRTARPRQQTLRATVNWSHDLLSQPERVLFRRLAVFVGSWTLAAAEAIGTGAGIAGGDILALLSRLVDKSLVIVEKAVDGSSRYRLLEMLRQYGHERLAENGEGQATQSRHAAYYGALAEQAGTKWYGPEQELWLARLETDRANLREALRWFQATGDVEAGLKLGIALGRFWVIRGPLTEGRERLGELLAVPGASVTKATRALALMYVAALSQRQGDWDAAMAQYTESLVIRREIGDRRGQGRALVSLGNVEFLRGHYGDAYRFLEDGLAIAKEIGDQWAISYALEVLGQVALMQGELATARFLLDEALAGARDRGDQSRVLQSQHTLGCVALAAGNYREARALYREALATARDADDQTQAGLLLTDLASLAAAQGRPEVAVRLAGAAAAQRAGFGAPFAGTWTTWFARWLEPAQQMLSEGARAVAWGEGQAMTLEQAVAHAVDLDD